MMPIVNGLENEFQGQVTVIRLNAVQLENDRLMLSYGFRGHPSFVVIDASGQETARFIGPQTSEQLAAAMTAVAP
ncbi:MAG: thioredoxin family protein [Anaerolineae bacterium]